MRRASQRESRPAVFLDRDGTINLDPGYVHRVEDLAFFPGVPEALARLRAAGFLLVVVTNQSGVARGLYGEGDVLRFHEAMGQRLAAAGAEVAAFHVCPFHPTAGVGAYRRASRHRKPGLGMFEDACAELPIDGARSWMVGDKLDDMLFARAAGLRGILVQTGHGAAQLERLEGEPWFEVAPSLVEASAHILASIG